MSSGHWDAQSQNTALRLTGVFSILPPISDVCTHAFLHNLYIISQFASILYALLKKAQKNMFMII